jgi:threonine dehydrogenase-like Zn-dependent dehydrogenase
MTCFALTVTPGTKGSVAFDEVPEPAADPSLLLVETIAIGVCGTDREILAGDYGEAPPGERRLILGHESIGRVLSAPADSSFHAGDFVVAIVRRPDPVPCPNCAVGEWDMCRNGQYTECGIKKRHGFAVDRFLLEPAFAVRTDPRLGELAVLLEPTSVVAKAWDHIERIGHRATFSPSRVLVTGAGPIGLLSALLGKQRGLDVVVFDRVEHGAKPDLVRALGASYHHGDIKSLAETADITLECTGAPAVIGEVLTSTRANGIVCLTGVSSGGHAVPLDLGALNRELVLENTVIFGSVNANRRHYEKAASALASADRDWLARLISRRVPREKWADALAPSADSIKTILELNPGARTSGG